MFCVCSLSAAAGFRVPLRPALSALCWRRDGSRSVQSHCRCGLRISRNSAQKYNQRSESLFLTGGRGVMVESEGNIPSNPYFLCAGASREYG